MALADLMKEWDDIASAKAVIDPKAPARELARMEQRRIERKIDLARRITETVGWDESAATKDEE